MSDQIVAIFHFLESSLGMHPATVAANALLFALVFALLALYLFAKVRSARKVIHQLAERLGYEPPYGDGTEVLHEEVRKDIVQRGKEVKAEQLEQRVAELETEAKSKDANLATLQQRSSELEGQLQQAALQQDKLINMAGEQEQAHRGAIEQLEQHIRQVEADSNANLSAHQQHAKDLENQLQQAYFQIDKITAVANDQSQAHRKTAEQFEQRIHEAETQSNANLTALQRHAKELEDQLLQASLRNESAAAQASEQAQAHNATVELLQQRIGQIEADSNANLAALHDRSKELEEQLQQAFQRNEKVMSQASEQAQTHRANVEQLAQRMQQMEAEGNASIAAIEQHSKDLEQQLQQASLHNDQLVAEATEQAQSYRTAVEQHQQRIQQIEAESSASLIALRQRSSELEEQLERAAILNNRITAQANDQAQAHRNAIEQLEQRVRQVEAERDANLAGFQQRAKNLEEQLQQAVFQNNQLTAHVNEQSEAHRGAIEQLEQRIRQIEGERDASLAAIRQHAKSLEEQLQQAAIQNNQLTTQVNEQADAHHGATEQLEQRIRQIEGGRDASLAAIQQHAKNLEEQLQQAAIQNNQLTTQVNKQADVHHGAIEQLEQRIRQIEAERDASLAAIEQRSKELENRLQEVHLRAENEKTLAQQQLLERAAGMETLSQRLSSLEAEKESADSQLGTLHARVKELQDQLQQATASANQSETASGNSASDISAQLLHRAEGITACAVGTLLRHGLVAAESYASSALAASPHSIDAAQLLAELARIRRAYPEGLPSVTEAVTTFDQRAASFFAADPAHAADIAEDEAQRRSRAGLNRSALLVANMALELRRKTDAENSPAILELQQLKASLLARLGNNARA
jgi:chromosome segregation ATPase